MNFVLHPGPLADRISARLAAWERDQVVRRLWEKDPRLWVEGDLPDELVDRLGWLDLPQTSRSLLLDLRAAAEDIRGEFDRIVLVGMGGSSLAPDVLARTFSPALPFTVLDTTHPVAVAHVVERHDPARTFVIVSSKSGTTLETLSLFRTFWDRIAAEVSEPGRHFAAVSDPRSALIALADERGFRHAWEADPAVGGRFSALSAFGLAPGAIMGVDVGTMLERARQATRASHVRPPDSPAACLGALLGEAALAGRDKVTFLTSAELEAFPDWAEQLIAESTGKDGTGIVPIAGEAALQLDAYGEDRVFVALVAPGDEDTDHRLVQLQALGYPTARLGLEDALDLGAQFQVWEIAVALAGVVLEIHPFNQPNVELAKRLAKEAMGGDESSAEPVAELPGTASGSAGELATWLEAVRPGDYVGIQAYLPPGDLAVEAVADSIGASLADSLAELRATIGAATGAATTFGWGPRFLHSTGQLHKGGPNNGLFLQLVDRPEPDLAVPETDFTFGQLIRAQSMGDFRALEQEGRRVLRVQLGPDPGSTLTSLLRDLDPAGRRQTST